VLLVCKSCIVFSAKKCVFFAEANHKKQFILHHLSESLLCAAQGCKRVRAKKKKGGVLRRQGASTAMQGTLHLTEVPQSLAPFPSFFFFSSGQAFLLTAAVSAASSSVSTLPSFIFTSMASISRPAEGI